MVVIVPTSTPLYSILVLPASSPSADPNTILIFGPSLSILEIATQAPTTAAIIGITQTTEIGVFFLATARDSGTGGIDVRSSAMSNLLGAGRVPDQPGVERFDRQHRQHHHRREKEQSRSGF